MYTTPYNTLLSIIINDETTQYKNTLTVVRRLYAFIFHIVYFTALQKRDARANAYAIFTKLNITTLYMPLLYDLLLFYMHGYKDYIARVLP